MIDIHSHILPSLDDGAGNWEESILMARSAVQSGVHLLYATPHHENGRYHNEAPIVTEAVIELNSQLRALNIPLRVVPGLEVRVYKELLNDLDRGCIISLNHSRYILIEFPSDRIPNQIEELIHELSVIGKVAILAHPERNKEIARNPQKLFQLIESGLLSQITAGALTGAFGRKVCAFALKLCKDNLVHFIASDAHNTSDRPFGLADAYQIVTDQLGNTYSEYYQQNARELAEDKPIVQWTPLLRKRSFIERLFHG